MAVVDTDNASTATGATNASKKPSLYDVHALEVDENGNWIRPEYPRYESELAPARPFLVPSFDDEVVEILPSVKQNRKINFNENVQIMEIENRFQMLAPEEQVEDDDEEVAYEIEIVEGGNNDDADFYLEMIDGEIFYVFETEDDISDDEDSSDDSSDEDSSEEDSMDETEKKEGLQLDFGNMLAPNLDASFNAPDDKPLFDEKEDTAEDEKKEKEEMPQSSETPELTEEQTKPEPVAKPPTLEVCSPPAVESEKDTPPSRLTRGPESPQKETKRDTKQSKQELEPTPQSDPLSCPSSPTKEDLMVSPSKVVSPGTPRSILKACPPSPKVSSPRKKKKEKSGGAGTGESGKKDKKAFTKTYVRADDFDGEHRVYSWQKPAWASERKLRNTGKGDDILKGGNLAAPITDAKQLLETGKVKWEKPEWASEDDVDANAGDDANAQEALIKKIQETGLNLPTKRKGGKRLKISLNGSILRDGGDIVKPITKATVIKKPTNINTIANPKILRATPIGSKLKERGSLEAPITQATTLKKYQFSKPSWTKAKLHSTQAGDVLKKGGDVAMPITQATAEKNKFEKPDWKTKRGLGRQRSAERVEEEAKLKEYKWEKPEWALGRKLKKTQQGSKLEKGDLARPITSAPHLRHVSTVDENRASSNNDTPAISEEELNKQLMEKLPERKVDELQSFSEHGANLQHCRDKPRRRNSGDPSVKRSNSMD